MSFFLIKEWVSKIHKLQSKFFRPNHIFIKSDGPVKVMEVLADQLLVFSTLWPLWAWQPMVMALDMITGFSPRKLSTENRFLKPRVIFGTPVFVCFDYFNLIHTNILNWVLFNNNQLECRQVSQKAQNKNCSQKDQIYCKVYIKRNCTST